MLYVYVFICSFIFSSSRRYLIGLTAKTQRCGIPLPKTCPRKYFIYWFVYMYLLIQELYLAYSNVQIVLEMLEKHDFILHVELILCSCVCFA